MKRIRFAIAAAWMFALLVVPLEQAIGSHRGPKLQEQVELPASYELDFSLASRQRTELRVPNTLVSEDAAGQVGAQVFSELTKTQMISDFGLPYHWTFSLLNSPGVNAVSLPDGEVAAYSGLAHLIGTDRGLWAAVLSHEIAHVARRHAVEKALFHFYIQQQIDYWKTRQRLGDRNAGWAVLAITVAGKIAEAKLSRALEHDADIQGMLLMSRAGYHPDYAFAMHHLLRLATGEQSKFAAFFSDHPRWETRDQRNDRTYTQALAEYNRLWPDPGSSPGGPAPAVAFLGGLRSSENKGKRTADVTLALSCRNVVEPVTLHIQFSDKNGHRIPGQLPDYRNEAGSLEVRQAASCFDKDDALPTTIHIPTALAPVGSRRLEAEIELLAPDGHVLERSKQIDIHLPKRNPALVESARVEIEPPVDGVLTAANVVSSTKSVPVSRFPGSGADAPASSQPNSSATETPATVGIHRRTVSPEPSPRLPDTQGRERQQTVAGLDPAIQRDYDTIASWWPKVPAGAQNSISKNSQAKTDLSPPVFSTQSLAFPPLDVNTKSATASVTLTNTGEVSFRIANVRIAGSSSADFSETNTCGEELAAKSSCTLRVRFAPTESGSRTAALAVYDDRDRPYLVLLTGTGVQPIP